jgi:membrane-associated phospholipid phosphatase
LAEAREAGLSRLYGGIHYRFDIDVGASLGRQVAELALQKDINGHESFGLR